MSVGSLFRNGPKALDGNRDIGLAVTGQVPAHRIVRNDSARPGDLLYFTKGVKSTQSNKEVLFREREKYSQDGETLIHASEVIAAYFQTVATANNYWK